MTYQPEKEVRFAVVMYGGVSLAIYINGVTQELHSLVRATARSRGNSGADYHIAEAKGVEAVYRELGEYLKSRFVIDILSGTSAGGINAVYLAKALANGQQINKLRDLWVSQGDINLLVNDKKSTADIELKSPKKPTSLLNSQRMYYQLLYALQGMKETGTSSQASSGLSPYVEELDLYTTATDLRGLKSMIRLSDGEEAEEYRYRNVFHFHYSTEQAAGTYSNDFREENDPFLAFAARCTSSFPFAFEPMCLQDIQEVLNTRQFKNYQYIPDQWRRFFKDYDSKSFPEISFGDGGYLDNKPFSYATATLQRRRADLPVDRKLIYIEPAPEHLEKSENKEPPDAIENVIEALLTLPRYETIREDLQVVEGRNNVMRRVGNVVQNIGHIQSQKGFSLAPWLPSPNWRTKFLDQLVEGSGPGYLAYHQLRVEDVLSDLTSMIARALDWEEGSLEAADLASLLHDWRKSHYKASSKEKDTGTKRLSENDILFRLDSRWRIRRLSFVRGLIDELLNDLGNQTWENAGARVQSIFDHSKTKMPDAKTDTTDYRSALQWVKKELNEAYVELRRHGRSMRARNQVRGTSKPDEESAYVRKLKEFKSYIEGIGGQGNVTKPLQDLMRFSAARAGGLSLSDTEKEYYQGALNRIEELTQLLSSRVASSNASSSEKGLLRTAFSESGATCHQALNPSPELEEKSALSTGAKKALKTIRKCLNFYYDRFEYFDMLTFPITYGTETGEADEVEIIRISPEDATSLKQKEESHTKLLGTKLGNFGAFFNRQWRENDMLWGRLDGAECLINALLPDPADTLQRERFIRKAQQAILQDFQNTETGMTALPSSSSTATDDPTSLINEFTQRYKVSTEFPSKDTLEVTGRAARVTGDLLGNLADKYPALTNPAGIISRISQIFLGIVQIAIPESIPSLIFRNLVGWVYLAELVLFFGGQFFKQTAIANFGLTAFAVTAAFHIAVLSIRNVIIKKWKNQKVLQTIAFVISLLIVVGLGILVYAGLIYLGAFPTPGGPASRFINMLKGIWSG